MKSLLPVVLFSTVPLLSFPVEGQFQTRHLFHQAASCLTSFIQTDRQKPRSLLKEIKRSNVKIESTVYFDTPGVLEGEEALPAPLLPDGRESSPEGRPAKYGWTYTAPINAGAKGRLDLSFQVKGFSHWIYWPSDVAEPDLTEDTVRAVFNRIYREVYGIGSDWMAERGVLTDILSSAGKNNLHGHGLRTAFNLEGILYLEGLLFKKSPRKLKKAVIQALNSPHKHAKPHPAGKTLFLIRKSKMPPLMKRAAMGSLTPEELKNLRRLKKLPKEDIELLYNSAEKIQALDMRSVSTDTAVRLLSESRVWREAVTQNQIQQLDAGAIGIQYIFSPILKHSSGAPPSRVISIDNLTDKQINNMDRGTFLWDVFILSAEIYAGAPLSYGMRRFRSQYEKRMSELNCHPRPIYYYPSFLYSAVETRLGFYGNFKKMTPDLKRELFKKEIELITDTDRQRDILYDEDFEDAVYSAFKCFVWLSTP